MSSVLTEELGPRGQRRIRVASWVSLALILAALGFAVYRFQVRGELAPDLWRPFTVGSNWGFLWDGLVGTMKAALTAMVLAVAVGFVMALGRLSRNTAPAVGRAAPTSSCSAASPCCWRSSRSSSACPRWGSTCRRYVALVVALTIYNSAVLAEIFRAGVLSLDRGQTEAAQAIGLRYRPMMRLIILPQAVRRMIPAIVAQLATVTKDTSLGFVIGYTEFLRQGQSISQAFPYPEDAQALQRAADLHRGRGRLLGDHLPDVAAGTPARGPAAPSLRRGQGHRRGRARGHRGARRGCRRGGGHRRHRGGG